ncbi:DUF2613 domain-containing protein [Rhodococcus sp. BP-349]|uniref:DUF2613 domain-containing protein n=1 Tax=unclassified Rhodococcus (in: high G+C Gram-positive bacteria) TaxID=192944 RepID=UPI001C9A652E|nr:MULTISPECIES: DUF2613 domain-containing protein [unclassified Rhodococcus (in: high G+C Gram-positive bacteria)]MBY6537546.1 DUF2613 domain-containing protein [Rhodococcus sp. BP-363]MBY6541883.1 DUF2613 domain-containing protein [Rhodococcus sp. BP-369]MBY6561113.1 DUF2613 domain-containing protein [Rhodococcus sp. BP-370]MBY6575405.1 DUF2613 domain-containing protein [Rhodococcus sp. BP-364]MBY6584706.1 DUF2613 domain-containing protein [Rhodococcus sp. BP-358]
MAVRSVVMPAVASLLVGGVLSAGAVVGLTWSAEETVRPETTVTADPTDSVLGDVQYGSR